MNILFLNASPRKNGYTEKILRFIEKGIDSKHNIDWVYTNNLNMKPCQGCLKCRPNKECILTEDDAHRVSRMIRKADVLVIGSPTYFGNITGPLRTLIDRCLTAFEDLSPSGLEIPVPLHKGKKAAMVTVCNSPYPISQYPSQGQGALQAMETILNAGGYDIIGNIMLDGAASLSEIPLEIQEKAEKLGTMLNF
jgi:multimeric flavodoxin WrbA